MVYWRKKTVKKPTKKEICKNIVKYASLNDEVRMNEAKDQLRLLRENK